MDMGFGEYLQFVFALIFVLALIALLAVAARRLGFGYRVPSRGKRARRLAVVEVVSLDPRRRLALVRRDQVEYLVLLGTNADLLLEGGIPAPADGFGEVLAETVAADRTETPR